MYTLSACFIFFAVGLLAQPTVTFDDYFIPIGGSWTEQQTENFDPGDSGENVSWDFTDLQLVDNIGRFSVLDPLATPFPDSFPQANYVLFAPDTSSLEDEFYNYQYYQVNENLETVALLGFVAVVVSADTALLANDTIFTIFDNPQNTGGQFPFQFGDTHEDSAEYRSQVAFNNGDSTLILTTISRRSEVTTVDGYGTLITPAGTFPDALRLRTVRTVRDSIVGFGFPIPPTERIEVNHLWLAAGEQTRLLSVDSIPLPGGGLLQQSGFYRLQVGTPSSTNNLIEPAAIDLQVYPNPTHSVLQIRFQLPQEGTVVARLYTLEGRLLRQSTTQPTNGAGQLDMLLTHLPAANYVLVLNTDVGVVRRLISKQ